jgi:hypothetical protein
MLNPRYPGAQVSARTITTAGAWATSRAADRRPDDVTSKLLAPCYTSHRQSHGIQDVRIDGAYTRWRCQPTVHVLEAALVALVVSRAGARTLSDEWPGPGVGVGSFAFPPWQASQRVNLDA